MSKQCRPFTPRVPVRCDFQRGLPSCAARVMLVALPRHTEAGDGSVHTLRCTLPNAKALLPRPVWCPGASCVQPPGGRNVGARTLILICGAIALLDFYMIVLIVWASASLDREWQRVLVTAERPPQARGLYELDAGSHPAP